MDMCGILVTSRGISDLSAVIETLSLRGPDATSRQIIKGVNFVHTLLSITGSRTIQPFVDDANDRVALFNGEIYNYLDFGAFDSDGQCLLPLYGQHGDDFIKYLDGEFALALFDFRRDRMIISTDIFATKTLWWARESGDFGVSSYKSCLQRTGFKHPVQIDANSTKIFRISDRELLEERPVHVFDLNQHKSNFDDWTSAFQRAIHKRTRNVRHGIFVGLSSGYDSGAIACELTRQAVPFSAYSIMGAEHRAVMEDRIRLVPDGLNIELDLESFLAARQFLKDRCEEYLLQIDNGEDGLLEAVKERYAQVCSRLAELTAAPGSKARIEALKQRKCSIEKRMRRIEATIEYRRFGQKLTDDNGAIGMSFICSIARPRGQLIHLSGSGADEIFSDYGFKGIKHYGHSTIGGHFAGDLSNVFPWKNFFGNSQRAYLAKEGHVAGTHGVEGRYPYLDKDVVQEFLWLDSSLKNKHYKAPLHNYLTENEFPFVKNCKIGFGCGFGEYRDDYVQRQQLETAVGVPRR